MSNPGEWDSHRNLPYPLSSLVGRDDDLEWVCARLRDPGIRLLTLTGPAGVGKTRLGLEAAARLRGDFSGGVWFVELASVSEPGLVASTIASVFRAREQQGTTAIRTLSEVLSAGPVLLVLDNCEHLLGPCAQIVSQLLQRSPELKILTTSRQRLGISGEMSWQVQTLARPASLATPSTAQLQAFPAVRLFVDRARAFQDSFAINDENSSAIAQVCTQLDGIPLAIELAASWIPVLSVEQIAERLDDRFRLLENRNLQSEPRQATLRKAIDWSYGLLTEQEQILFYRLSGFADGYTLDSLEAVCADNEIRRGDVMRLLANLIEKSLVSAEPTPDERQRYRMLETLRAYARERLVLSGEAQWLYRRHAEHYLTLAEEAEASLWGPDQTTWLRRLSREHENFRVALRWSAGRGEAEIAQRLGAALGQFWRVRGHLSEGRRWLEQALEWESGASTMIRARALEACANLCRDQGDLDAAERFYRQGLDLRVRNGDTQAIPRLLTSLSMVAQFRDDHVLAINLQEQCLTLHREQGDQQGIAVSLMTLGTLAQLQGDSERAIQRYQETLALFRDLDDKHGTAATLSNLGTLSHRRGDYQAANHYYGDALTLFREIGDFHEIAACLSNLGGVARDIADPNRARAFYSDSLQLFNALCDTAGIAALLLCLGSLSAQQGDAGRATRLFAAVETLHTSNDIVERASLGPAHHRTIAALREQLGQVRFDRIWAEGRAWSLDDAVTHALENPTTPTGALIPLTHREHEVARCIAQGQTNREIAAALYISERTVDTHVEHILAKLGVRSRVQVAAWIATS